MRRRLAILYAAFFVCLVFNKDASSLDDDSRHSLCVFTEEMLLGKCSFITVALQNMESQSISS